MLEILGHAPLALLAATVAVGAGIAIAPGPTLRRVAGLSAMSMAAAALIGALTIPTLSVERYAVLGLAVAVAGATLAMALSVRLREAETGAAPRPARDDA